MTLGEPVARIESRRLGATLLLALAGAVLLARSAQAQPAGPGECEGCGPAPGYPSWGCADGQHAGGRGPCVTLADGTCRWIRAACPSSAGDSAPGCAEGECGSPPAIREWLCPSGERGHFGACVREQGRCGWVFRPCRGVSRGAPPPLEAPGAQGGSGPPLSGLAKDVSEIARQLEDEDPAQRIAACERIRGAVRAHGVEALSGALTPSLLERLDDPDAQVRLCVVQALRALDGRSLPALRAALGRERDAKVAKSLAAAVRQLEERPAAGAHPCLKLRREVIVKWPVRELCDPIGHYPPVLAGLPDGTSVYRKDERECFRGRISARCRKKCLPGSALIDTPEGPRRIDRLRVGSIVWSVDANGGRIAAPLVRVGSVEVGERHELVRVRLADGRSVKASHYHPTPGGGLFGELGPGDTLDGSTVIEVGIVDHPGRRTFDILPDGPTGLYFADGILLGSTLLEE